MATELTPERKTAAPDAAATLRALAPLGPTATLSLDGSGVRLLRRGRLSSATTTDVSVIICGDAADAQRSPTTWCADGIAATVCARAEEQDMVFFSRVLRVRPLAAEPGAAPEIEVTLAMPAQIIVTRRRTTFRIAVAEDDEIELRVWRIDQYAILRDQPPPSRALKAQLCDLGASGMRATLWAGKVQALQLVEDQRFRVEMKSDGVEMLFDARLRHPRATNRDDAFAICGFEFMHDDGDIESRRNRQKLDAVLAKLQRSAARREAA